MLDVGAGYGPTEYYFSKDMEAIDEPSNRDVARSYSVSIGAFGRLGARWQLASPESRLNAFIDVNYHVQSISSVFN